MAKKRSAESVDCCTVDPLFENMNWSLEAISERKNTQAGELALWRKVIIIALYDFLNESPIPSAQLAKKEAERWLLHNESKFRAVCTLAEIDPVKLRRMVKVAVNNPRTAMIELKKRITRP